MDVRIESPLPLDECRRRIEASFDGRLGRAIIFSPFGQQKLLGRIDGEEIRTTLAGGHVVDRRYRGHTNAPVFVGRVIRTPSGSALVGSVGHRDYVKVFLVLWWGLLLGVFLPIAIIAVIAKATMDLSASEDWLYISDSIWILPIFLVVLAAFGIFLIRILNRMRDRDADDMLEELATAIQGGYVRRTNAAEPGWPSRR